MNNFLVSICNVPQNDEVQNIESQTNLRHLVFPIVVQPIDNPEKTLSFDFASLGDGYIFGREKDDYLICRTDFLQIRNSLPANKISKTIMEIFQMLELPKRIGVDLGSTSFIGWLIATCDGWLCFEHETGRFWLSENSFRILRWRVVDN